MFGSDSQPPDHGPIEWPASIWIIFGVVGAALLMRRTSGGPVQDQPVHGRIIKLRPDVRLNIVAPRWIDSLTGATAHWDITGSARIRVTLPRPTSHYYRDDAVLMVLWYWHHHRSPGKFRVVVIGRLCMTNMVQDYLQAPRHVKPWAELDVAKQISSLPALAVELCMRLVVGV